MFTFQSYISNELNFTSQHLSNNLGIPPPVRNHRTSNATAVSIKDVFDVNGGPNSQIYGPNGNNREAGHVNQAYEPVVEDDDRNSLRLAPRNLHVAWNNNNSKL